MCLAGPVACPGMLLYALLAVLPTQACTCVLVLDPAAYPVMLLGAS